MVMVFVRSFVLFVWIFNLKGLILPYFKVNRCYFSIHLGVHHTSSSLLVHGCSRIMDEFFPDLVQSR
jgi:hypothetical protein